MTQFLNLSDLLKKNLLAFVPSKLLCLAGDRSVVVVPAKSLCQGISHQNCPSKNIIFLFFASDLQNGEFLYGEHTSKRVHLAQKNVAIPCIPCALQVGHTLRKDCGSTLAIGDICLWSLKCWNLQKPHPRSGEPVLQNWRVSFYRM